MHFLSLFNIYTLSTTHLYNLSLHDALPISPRGFTWSATLQPVSGRDGSTSFSGLSTSLIRFRSVQTPRAPSDQTRDRKSTRLNSSHVAISYAVFCLKKNNSDDSFDLHSCY